MTRSAIKPGQDYPAVPFASRLAQQTRYAAMLAWAALAALCALEPAPARAAGLCGSSSTTVEMEETEACVMSNDETLTVANTGSIVVNSGQAVTAGDRTTIINNGFISAGAGSYGIRVMGGNTLVSLTNGVGGEIAGATAVANNSSGTITTISNSGNLIGREWLGIANNGIIGEVINTGTGIIRSESDSAIANSNAIEKIENSGKIYTEGSGYAIRNFISGSLGTLDNSGEISNESGVAVMNAGTSEIATLRNRSNGKIVSGSDAALFNSGAIEMLINEGLIEGGETVIQNDGVLTEMRNSGTIRSTVPEGYAFRNDNSVSAGLFNSGVLDGKVLLGSATTLYLQGSKARVTGAVTGGAGSAVVVDGQFTTENDFSIDNFTVTEQGQLILGNHVIKLHAGDFKNQGSAGIQAGNTATIEGDYAQSKDAVLVIEASSASKYGKLVINGNAKFEGSPKILVGVTEKAKLANQDVLAGVVKATSLEADGDFLVADTSELFDFKATVKDNSVDLLTILNEGEDPDDGKGDGEDGGGNGGTGGNGAGNSGGSKGGAVSNRVNAQGFGQGLGAARVLDGFVAATDNTGDMANVVTAFGRLGSQQEVADAVAQTLPLMSANLNQVTMGSMQGVNRVIQGRQDGVGGFSGMSSGDGFLADKHIWFKPLGSYADQDDRDGVAGYRASTYGFVFGGDAVVGKSSRLGLAFSYARSDVDGKSTARSNSADIDAYQLIAYGSHSISAWPDVEVNWQADLGLNSNDGKRTIRFGGLDRTAKSDFDSTTAHLGAGISKGFQVRESTRVTPALRLDYFRIRNESYTETGADTLNLRVGSQTSEQLIAMLEGRVQHQLTERTALTASLGVGYDLIGEDSSITSSYVGGGAAFRTPGMDASRWLGRAGLGLAFQATEAAEITARYDLEGRDGFLAQTASVNVRWAF